MTWQPEYASFSEFAEFVRVPDMVDTDAMGLAVSAASRAVDEACRRQFGQVTATRYYTARWSALRCEWEVETDDVAAAIGATVHVDLDGSGGYATAITSGVKWLPLNAIQDGEPYTLARFPTFAADGLTGDVGAVKVTATFGWADIPATVREATLLQASRFLARRDSPFGVAGSPDIGSELRLLARVDPDVAVMLRPYRRPKRWAGATFA